MANNTKKNDLLSFAVKVLVILLAVVMLLYAGVSIGQGTLNFRRWNLSKSEQSGAEQSGAEQPGGEELNTGNSGLLSEDKLESNGIAFMKTVIPVELYNDYGVTAAAETALQLTVTPTNEGADLSDGIFSIKFKDASSEWATGKTLSEYVTLSTTDSTHATVSCLQAFGEQIIVVYTYTGEQDGEIKTMTAEYPLDYAKRIVKGKISFGGSILEEGSVTDFIYLMLANIGKDKYTHSESGEYISDYTVDDIFSIDEASTFGFTDTFKSACISAGVLLPGENLTGKVVDGKFILADSSSILEYYFGDSVYKTEAFRNVVTAQNSNGIFELNITLQGTYSSYSFTVKCTIDLSGFPIAAQGVQYQDSGHIF